METFVIKLTIILWIIGIIGMVPMLIYMLKDNDYWAMVWMLISIGSMLLGVVVPLIGLLFDL